jgi:anti-anti-sigma factor
VEKKDVAERGDRAWFLAVERTDHDGVPVFHVAGRLGVGAADSLIQAISGSDLGTAADAIIVDLAAVDYLSSAGLRALESVAHRLASERREVVVCGAGGSVELALSFCGPRPNIAVELSLERAIVRVTTESRPQAGSPPTTAPS